MLQVTLIFKAVHKPCSQQKLAHLVVIFCILNNVNKFLSCLDLILSKKSERHLLSSHKAVTVRRLQRTLLTHTD